MTATRRRATVAMAATLLLAACGSGTSVGPDARPTEIRSVPEPMFGDADGDGTPDDEDTDGPGADGSTAPDGDEPSADVTTPDATRSGPLAPPPPDAPEVVDALPATWAAVLEDGSVVVVDTASGDVVDVVVAADEAPGRDEPRNGYVDVQRVTSDADLVLDTCCEPAVGVVVALDRSGEDGDQRTLFGFAPDVDDAGVHVVTVQFGALVVDTLDVGPDRARTIGDPTGTEAEKGFAAPAFDAPGERIAAEDVDVPGSLRVVEPGDRSFDDPRRLDPPDGRAWRAPEWRGDGRLLAVEHDAEADHLWATDAMLVLLDPATGAVEDRVPLPVMPWTIRYDASRTWLLLTGMDGSVHWLGGGRSGRIDDGLGVRAADW